MLGAARSLMHGGWRAKLRPEALRFVGQHLMQGWTVVDRLGEITVPTLVMAGRNDFVFPQECQRELAAGIPHAQLRLIDHAGHNPHDEQTAEVHAGPQKVHPGAGAMTRERARYQARVARQWEAVQRSADSQHDEQ